MSARDKSLGQGNYGVVSSLEPQGFPFLSGPHPARALSDSDQPLEGDGYGSALSMDGDGCLPLRGLGGLNRSSQQLRASAKGSVLERAKLRKVLLLEGETSSSKTLAIKWSSNKVLSKSAHCGVKLSVAKAEELHDFMLRG